MQTTETNTPQQPAPATHHRQQRTLSTDQAIHYFLEVYGLVIAKATLYKKRSLEPRTFPGRRSPFGRLVFDPAEIDRYMQTGNAHTSTGDQEA